MQPFIRFVIGCMQLLFGRRFRSHQRVKFSCLLTFMHVVPGLMSFRMSLPWTTGLVALMVTTCSTVQAARVSSKLSKLDPDCLPPGTYWYNTEPEPNKEKLMKDLGCYCKKAGHLRSDTCRIVFNLFKEAFQIICDNVLLHFVHLGSYFARRPRSTVKLSHWVLLPLQVASMKDCPNLKWPKTVRQPERSRWFHAEVLCCPASVSPLQTDVFRMIGCQIYFPISKSGGSLLEILLYSYYFINL